VSADEHEVIRDQTPALNRGRRRSTTASKPREIKYCVCGRIAQRGESMCWYCDGRVPDTDKRAARAARWRSRLIAPDFGTLGSRVRYREALAEATMEGELIPPVAAIGLKAVNDAGDDLSREKSGVVPGAFTVIIDASPRPLACRRCRRPSLGPHPANPRGERRVGRLLLHPERAQSRLRPLPAGTRESGVVRDAQDGRGHAAGCARPGRTAPSRGRRAADHPHGAGRRGDSRRDAAGPCRARVQVLLARRDPGAFYAAELERAERDGQIKAVPWEPRWPVVTAWDLGIDDATAIVFAQVVGREVRVIDYYEAQGRSLADYARVLLSDKPYRYSEHLLPHDAGARELGTGKSCAEMLTQLNIRPIRILPKLPVMDGINAVRLLLPRSYFDRDRCKSLLRALEHYAADWDEATKSFARRPRHDWASHASDALRYLAQGIPGVAAPSPGRPVRVPMPAYDFTAPARRVVGPGPGSEWL
jgi:hypothetical protein